MTPAVRVRRKQARVLAYLLQARHLPRPASSLEVCRAARVRTSTFYPLMARLETAGWVKPVKEVLPKGAVVPPRTFYTLTTRGAEWAQQAVDEQEWRRAFWRRWVLRKRRPTPVVAPARSGRTARDAGFIEDIKADRAYWDDKDA